MANILITGANQGIGYFMAEKLLINGHSVAVLDLETQNLRPLKEKYGDRLLPLVCDLRSTEQVEQCVNEMVSSWKTVDIAIHNACLCTFAPMEATSEETYQEVFDVNFFGAVRLTKAVLPHMRRQKSGRILLTSSGVGVTGFHDISPYASSKGAIEALAKCLSIEYRHKGISFHILHPPITRTKSSGPFPLPAEYKADPKTVGYGLADRIEKKDFIICHSFGQMVQTRICYLFPLSMGRLMSGKMKAMTEKAP